ncbi:MAG TPA: fluoride efflux transporter CrcB [Vicinamibacterales bacterium]|nr:fluoride efflux transporter CrcB [Vicinamibacterales bacterium]
MQLLAIGIGGALGAIARYVLGGAVHRLTPGFFPYGTFVVNVVGCLAFGVIVGLAESRLTVGPVARAFLLIGVLGGFTTFSSFTFETFELLRDGQVMHAAANVAGQVLLGFMALWAGFVAGRAV